MNINGFKKISDDQAAKTYGGSGMFFLGTLLPLVLPAVSSIVSSFKLLFSDKGEVKNKDGTHSKWEKHEEKANDLTKVSFIY